MPNWCFNEVEIKGTKKAIEKVAKLMKQVEETGDFFELVYPTPDGIGDRYPHWYDWRVKYWGTKWDIDTESLGFTVNQTSVTMSFDSAWSPPVEFFAKFSEIFKVTVEIRFLEEGRDFAGCCICKAGKIVSEDVLHDVDRKDILYYDLDPEMVMDEDEE